MDSFHLVLGVRAGPDSHSVPLMVNCEAGGELGGCGLLQITPITIVCSSLKTPSFCLYSCLIGKVSAGLKIGLFLKKDFCGTEESETCSTYTQSFCAWKAESVVIIYYIGGVNTVILLFHWNFPLQICIVNGSHRNSQL